jgi:Carboxypeptidase regulatory-like domain
MGPYCEIAKYKRGHMDRILKILILGWLSMSAALAQLPTATLLGQVKDASGGAVAGAKVTARNTDTGQTRNGVTGEDGAYRLDALPVGKYEISAEKPRPPHRDNRAEEHWLRLSSQATGSVFYRLQRRTSCSCGSDTKCTAKVVPPEFRQPVAKLLHLVEADR